MTFAIGLFVLGSLIGIAALDCRPFPKGERVFPDSWKVGR